MAKLKIQRHPLLIDNETQTVVEMDLRPGESLYSFLQRHILNLDGQQVVVHIGGKPAPRHLWSHIYPKQGNEIIVRNTVERSALFIIAIIALSIFTMGAAAAVAGAASAGGGIIGAAGFAVGSALGTGALATIAVGAMQVIGAMIINKVLGPKPPSASKIDRDNVYSLSALRNSARQYEPAGLLFGEIQVTPDVLSLPYSIYQGNDQYLAMVLTPGINVAKYDALYIGDTPVSNFQEIEIWQSGFSEMPNQEIPISGNVDTTAGAELQPKVEVIRTGSADTVRLQVDIAYLLFDLTTKGKPRDNQETILIQYRSSNGGTWQLFGSYALKSNKQDQQRVSFSKDVPLGRYDVRVYRMGLDTGTVQPNNSAGATAQFNWTTLVSYQQDTSDYRGIARIGFRARATGQFNGSPDQIRGNMIARPIPLWNGTQWVTATRRSNGLSNVAANVLKYIRGYYDEDGVLIAGMGWPDNQIDIESFKAWMLDCTLYNWNFDAWITSDRNHDEMLSSLALCGLGKIDFAPGKATAVWSAPNQPSQAIVNMGTITKSSFHVDYTLLRTADGIEYSYYDRTTNKTETLRVSAPGVETMLNPARVSGEGVSEEAHAAFMARYHMGQMLYQMKDVSYTTHIEFLTYGLMSVLQLQHDLTQWGYGGRLRGVRLDETSGKMMAMLDDAVPYPQTGNAYIGIRIPGELMYRIFTVVPFSGQRRSVLLEEAWPSDAALPGDDIDSNPEHDSIWIYDFKQTPGLRCRVVSMAPADDLKTAQISVVPESAEFWNYVTTGEYVPPPGQSLLNTMPVASNLIAKEIRVPQGNTIVSQINITWSVTGFADTCLVTCAADDGEPQEVATTSGRSASWRVDGPGTYLIVVRPYQKGIPGTAVSVVLQVYGENQPPVNPDIFAIDEITGGVRKYRWGWLSDTIQSSDMIGVEIRYTEGTVPSPDWETMTPLGINGYFAAAFESTQPKSGSYTFALRGLNSAGVLAQGMVLLSKTLGSNLGEFHENQQGINTTTAQILAEFNAAVAEQAQLVTVLQEQAAKAAQDIIDLQAIVDAPDHDQTKAYSEGAIVKSNGGLYVAKQDVPENIEITDTNYWSYIGQYASVAEAVGALAFNVQTLSNTVTVQQNQITVLSQDVSAVQASLADKADASAVQAIQSQVTQIGNDLQSQAQSITSLQNSLSGKADASAVDALTTRVSQTENNITSQGQSITSLQNSLSGKADASALQALQSTVTQQGNNISSNSTAITSVKSQIGGSSNLLYNSGFEIDSDGWETEYSQWPGFALWGRNSAGEDWRPPGTNYFAFASTGTFSGICAIRGRVVPVIPGKRVIISGLTSSHRCTTFIRGVWADESGAEIGAFQSNEAVGTGGGGKNLANWTKVVAYATTPANARTLKFQLWGSNPTADTPVAFFAQLMVQIAGDDQTVPDPWSPSSLGIDNKYASATQSLSTRVSYTESGIAQYQASWTMNLDVQGRVVGIRSVNNGATGTIDFVFDKVRFVSPSGSGARAEYANGNWKAYDANGTLRTAWGVNI